MQNTLLARKAGVVGTAGAVLWIIALMIEYGFGLFPPDGSGPLYVTNQILSFVALAAIAVGILGIIWGAGVGGRFGRIGVWLFVLGYGLIIVGGIMALSAGSDDSPIFIVFPIGGLLMDVGALLTGIAVVKDRRWDGWQRFMPLIYAAYLWLAIEVPLIMGVYADGPGLVPEIFQGIGLFFVALAVYTTQAKATTPQSSAVGQV
jgi:hypothetical protein